MTMEANDRSKICRWPGPQLMATTCSIWTRCSPRHYSYAVLPIYERPWQYHLGLYDQEKTFLILMGCQFHLHGVSFTMLQRFNALFRDTALDQKSQAEFQLEKEPGGAKCNSWDFPTISHGKRCQFGVPLCTTYRDLQYLAALEDGHTLAVFWPWSYPDDPIDWSKLRTSCAFFFLAETWNSLIK